MHQQLKKEVVLHSLEICNGELTRKSLHRAFSLTPWLKLNDVYLLLPNQLINRSIPANIVRHLELGRMWDKSIFRILNQQEVQPEVLSIGEQAELFELKLIPGSLMKL
jgi:hypothetical protein